MWQNARLPARRKSSSPRAYLHAAGHAAGTKCPDFVTRRCRPARGFRPGGRGHLGVNADAMAPPPQGCHLYFARRVTFLSCADTRMRRVTHEARRPSSAHGIAAPRRALLRRASPTGAPSQSLRRAVAARSARYHQSRWGWRCDHVHGCPAGSETAESRLPDPVLFQVQSVGERPALYRRRIAARAMSGLGRPAELLGRRHQSFPLARAPHCFAGRSDGPEGDRRAGRVRHRSEACRALSGGMAVPAAPAYHAQPARRRTGRPTRSGRNSPGTY